MRFNYENNQIANNNNIIGDHNALSSRSPSIISVSNDKSLKYFSLNSICFINRLVLNAPSRYSIDPLLSTRAISESNQLFLDIPLSSTPTATDGKNSARKFTFNFISLKF